MSKSLSATQIAAAVRQAETSAVSALQDCLATIQERDPQISAFVHLTEDVANQMATEIDQKVKAGQDPGPLAGVPVALKDNLCTRGIPTTCCSKILEGWKPPYEATVVRKLRKAGAVFVGKTNLDEFAMGSSTENSYFAPTRNPHDTTCVPGGSSGGSAAAVAADFVPLALGSDTGGSIRQPASLCGVVGVKPTYGRVSRFGLIAFASSLDQIGPFAHTVQDAAKLLEVIGGHDPYDSTSIPEEMPSLSNCLERGVEGLRIGVVSELTEDAAPDVKQRVAEATAALESGGAVVEEVSVPAAKFGISAYYLIAPAEASSNLARYDGVRYGLRSEQSNCIDMNIATRTQGFGDEVKRRIMLGTFALSAGYYDAYYGKALKVRTLIIADFERAYENFDALISPTSPTVAFPFGSRTQNPLEMYLSDVCTVPSSLAGHPAMSVPFGTGDPNENGISLPVGLQVMAPAMGEEVMFQVASYLESVCPSSDAAEKELQP